MGAVAGWFLYEPIVGLITQPLSDLDGANLQLNFQTIGAAFDLKLRIALWTGVILASPWWIFQIGAFIAPGLHKRGRLHIATIGLVGVILFAAGALSGVWMAPRAVEILQSFSPEDSLNLLQAGEYVSFYLHLVLAFGISFLLSEILVALNFAGVLSSRTTASARPDHIR